MNWNQIKGRWKQWQGKAKEQWGQLTNNDLTIIAGRREQFAGLLQERFGYAKDEGDTPLDEMAREAKL